MKLLITGGHLTPALAVIEALPEEIKPIYIGRKYNFESEKSISLEYKVITDRKVPFVSLTTGRFTRKLCKNTFISFFKIPYGILSAIHIIKKQKPDLVLSFGGYISVPIGIAAYLYRIPVIIHEQTLEAGLANKILSRIAIKVCISWKQSAKYFPADKIILTGNPIRNLNSRQTHICLPQENLPIIYVTGGSAGAHAINELVEGCLQNLLEKYVVIHQTGDSNMFQDYDRLNTLVKTFPLKLQKRYIIYKFLDPSIIGQIMDQAILVVSRSGINTVSEILSLGKPSLLIPLPYGQTNEQLKNAQFIKKAGIGEYYKQHDLDSVKFYEAIEKMIKNYNKYRTNTTDAVNLTNKNATDNIIKVIYEVFQKKPQT